MAITLSMNWDRDVYTADSIDLYGGVFKVVSEWTPETAEEDEPVEETIPLLAIGTSNAITEEVRDINNRLRLARIYREDQTKWEKTRLTIEADSGEIQSSLILDGRLVKGTIPGIEFSTTDGQNGGIPYVLHILRHAAWEDSASVNVLPAEQGCLNYTHEIADAPGDMLARVSQVSVGLGAGSSYDFDSVWIGIKPIPEPWAAQGDATDFNPSVPLGASPAIALVDTSNIVDASRESAAYCRTTFATQTGLRERARTQLRTGTLGSSIYQGRYLMLMAARVAASTTAGIQIRAGYVGMPAYTDYVTVSEEIEVTSTTWDVIPLGYLQLPVFFPVMGSNWPSTYFRLTVWAERLSGSGNLEFDDIILLPAEHMLSVTGVDGAPIQINTRDDDRVWQYGGITLQPVLPGTLSTKNFGVPPGTSMLVAVADESGNNESTSLDKIDVDLIFRPRWRNYAT